MINKNRIAIFAHYDKDSIIDDYVVFYLKALKEVVQKITFVSDCNLSKEEKAKLEGIADEIIAQPHGEYDFGSYKRGFLHAQDRGFLADCDELIFANDSCYGPFFPLENIFGKMQEKKCDFWGISENKYEPKRGMICFKRVLNPHLQSYFLVFNRKIFESEVFVDFMKKIKPEEKKSDVIYNYELGLSKMLLGNGFRKGVLVEIEQKSLNSVICDWDELILRHGMPFLKCSVPRRQNLQYTVADGYKDVIAKVGNYPVEIIAENVERTSKERDFLSFLPKKMRILAYKLIFLFKNLKSRVAKSFISE